MLHERDAQKFGMFAPNRNPISTILPLVFPKLIEFFFRSYHHPRVQREASVCAPRRIIAIMNTLRLLIIRIFIFWAPRPHPNIVPPVLFP